MTLSEQLSAELKSVLSGNPWYGPPVYKIIGEVGFEAAFERPPGSVHNIAGIILHMISWTEEVMDRLNGATAQQPTSGDWPNPGTPDEQKWQNYVNDQKLVNVNLLGVIQNYPEEQWNDLIKDDREHESGNAVSFIELVRGLIQLHIYHSGQIELLHRMTQIGE